MMHSRPKIQDLAALSAIERFDRASRRLHRSSRAALVVVGIVCAVAGYVVGVW